MSAIDIINNSSIDTITESRIDTTTDTVTETISLFSKPCYPKNILDNMKQEELKKYPPGTKINIADKNGNKIGFIRRCGYDNVCYWNGYVYTKTNFLEYDDFNEIFSELNWKHKGGVIQEITYFNDNVIGWDHAYSWDLENYTTFDMIIYEVMLMYDVCKLCKLC